MQLPLQISFRGIGQSNAIEAVVRKHAKKLERFYKRIIACRVTIEAPNHRHHQGNIYRIGIDLTVPGHEIAVGRNPAEQHAHEDIYVAIRDAFAAAQRQLQDYVCTLPRQQRRHHEMPPHGKVIRIIYKDGGYGFLQTLDGREIYFHRNSVLNNHFDDIEIGTEVRFVEEQGEEGPQASTVEIVGKDGVHIL